MNFQTPPDGCTALSRGFPAEGATGMRAVKGINFLLSFESLGYHSGTDGREQPPLLLDENQQRLNMISLEY